MTRIRQAWREYRAKRDVRRLYRQWINHGTPFDRLDGRRITPAALDRIAAALLDQEHPSCYATVNRR